MSKYLVISVISLVFFGKLFCQNDSTTKALIYFKEKGLILYLDGKKTSPYQDLRSISIGKHVVKAWAPTYNLYIDTFYAKKGQNEFYSKKLKHTNSFLEYRRDLRYRKGSCLVPLGLSVISAGVYNLLYNINDNKISDKRNRLSDKENEYNTSFSPDEFIKNREEYYAQKEDYEKLVKKQQNLKTQGIILTSTFAATSLTFFIINKVKKKLQYSETPLLSRVESVFDPINKQVCLTIKLY